MTVGTYRNHNKGLTSNVQVEKLNAGKRLSDLEWSEQWILYDCNNLKEARKV